MFSALLFQQSQQFALSCIKSYRSSFLRSFDVTLSLQFLWTENAKGVLCVPLFSVSYQHFEEFRMQMGHQCYLPRVARKSEQSKLNWNGPAAVGGFMASRISKTSAISQFICEGSLTPSRTRSLKMLTMRSGSPFIHSSHDRRKLAHIFPSASC